MWLPLVGLFLGFLIGNVFSFTIPPLYGKYMSVAILASLDSVFGGIKGVMEDKYHSKILLTGFFVNTLLAGSLAYIGDRVGVDLYYAAIFAFGVRIFNNLAAIRHHILDQWTLKKRPRRKPPTDIDFNSNPDMTVGPSDG